MGRTSNTVQLVLIGSSLILAGCGQPPPGDGDFGPDTAPAGTAPGRRHGVGSYHGSGWWWWGRSGTRVGSGTRTGGAARAGSPRGGFGASGHAAAGG